VLKVLDWHKDLSIKISKLADGYAAQHDSRIDAGFMRLLRDKQVSDPSFTPPPEFACRHVFGASGKGICR
jgi:hypothetical protein